MDFIFKAARKIAEKQEESRREMETHSIDHFFSENPNNFFLQLPEKVFSNLTMSIEKHQ